MFDRLPQELISQIFSFLSNNLSTLFSCSLTCRSFYPETRKYVFAKVELHVHAAPAHVTAKTRSKESKLFEVLTTSPHLISFIHELHVYDLFGEEGLVEQLSYLSDDEPSQDFLKNDDSLRVLSLVKNIRRITINGFNTRGWMTLHPDVRDAVVSALHYPDLTHIVLYAMSAFPIILLDGCSKSLQNVSITTIPSLELTYDSEQFKTVAEGQHSKSVYLKTLHLSTSTPNLARFVDWLHGPRCSLQMNCLEELVVRTTGNKHMAVQPLVWKLLSTCFSTIKHLEFYAYLPYGRTDVLSSSMLSLYDTINLGELPCLRKLVMRYWLSDLSDSTHQLALLTQLLSKLGQTSQLRELVLHFTIVHWRAPMDSDGAAAWNVLDSTISLHTPPFLNKVTIQFETLPRHQQEASEKVLTEGLPWLRERGLLSIDVLSYTRFVPLRHA